MAFENLAEKLQNIFKSLRGKGRLNEADVKVALREVRMALLEADVNFKVVKGFIASVQERAVGQEVLQSLTPGQTVIKIVHEEMIRLMGDETVELSFRHGNNATVVMLCGLQGTGKTTTAAKLAGKFKSQGKRPLLVACDIYRPAAIDQLVINGEKQGVPVFDMGTGHKPLDIAKAAMGHADKNGNNVVILDTAGRLHIDEDMMNELMEIKENIDIDHVVLTVDSMTGQDAVNVAETFNEKLEITGVILTKLDGDTRGGAALSVKAVTGKPILYVTTGEKLADIEQFYPDRMASRILGMGDVLTLIDKIQAEVDDEKAKELEKKIKKAEFDFNDYLEQFRQMKKMGGLAEIMKLMPGMDAMKAGNVDLDEGEVAIKRIESIIYSMTREERANPDLINMSRKRRIAAGSGVDIAEINRMMKQFEQSKKMMKQFSGVFGGKAGRRGGFKLPFGL